MPKTIINLGTGIRIIITYPPRQLNTDKNQKKLMKMFKIS